MNALFPTIFSGMIVLSVALLVIGIIKPEWVRFGKKQLNRITIVTVAIGLLLIGVIGAGTTQYAGENNAGAVHPGHILGEALYVVNNDTLHCDPGVKLGHAGASNDEPAF